MSLTAKILSIESNNKIAKALVRPNANCNVCNACAGLLKKSNPIESQQEIDVLINNFDIKVGDIVKIELSEFQGAKIAFILYGLPIMFFLIGMLSTPYLCNFLSIPFKEIFYVLGAFIGLFISYILIFFFLKFKKNNQLNMSITEIIDSCKK